MSAAGIGLDAIRALLLDRLESFTEAVIGAAPARRRRKTDPLRFLGMGGLLVEVHGRERGSWYCHSAKKGGGPFQLIQYCLRCSFRDAVKWAKQYLGISDGEYTSKPISEEARRERERKQAEAQAEEAAERTRRIAYAQRLASEASPIAGTLAERYLIDERGIPCRTNGWPAEAVRFHVSSRSLIVIATTAAGDIQAVQRVRLTASGKKAKDSDPTKRTNGFQDGAAVRLPGNADDPLLLAEGPEDGLSVWAATGHETWIALGSIGNITPPAERRVVVCRHDDKQWSPADRKLREAITGWRNSGIDLVVATPWPERHQDKTDFNDTIKAGGVAAVRERIKAALNPTIFERQRRPVDEARRILDSAIARFLTAASAYDPESDAPPPVHAARVDVGVGKSLIGRRGIAKFLAGMRKNGDKRSMVMAVPTHKLAEEQARAFEALPEARAAGLKAAIWRGREADDPDAPGEAMCRDLDRVADATAACVEVQSAVCKRKLKDGTYAVCPLFESCGYQRQRQQSADLWFVAHEMIYMQKPAAIGEVAILVVDESVWQDGLEGAGGPITLALDTLQATDQVPGNPINTQRLMFLRRRALRALQSRPDGPLRREWLLAAGFTAENAREARGLEWIRKVDPGIHPLMTAAERRAAAKAAATNRTIMRLAMFWRAIEALVSEGGPEASGWAALALKEDDNGSVRVLELKARKPVREGWQAPTLLLDALLNVDLVRPFWPQVELTADVAAGAPHQRIWQVVDSSYSKLRLEQRDDVPEKDQRRRAKNLRNLRAKLATIGRKHATGRVLVVAQKAIEEALLALRSLPPSIELAHHNAVAGRDGWKDVTGLVVVGRTAPSPANVERIAEALTGSAVPRLEGWYSRACIGRELASGAPMEAEADRHPDSIAEAIRWQICEGELVQIIGRARGVNRTEANPVDILVLTDVPLPLLIDGTLSQADLAPTPAELMLAAGGIAFENPADAATAYPGLWATRGAAKIAFQRASGSRLDTNPNKESLIRVCAQPPCEEDPTLRRMDYQVSGPGRSAAVAWCDLAMVPNPVTALEEALGPLAWCRVAEPPVSPEPDPCPPDPPEQPEPKPEPPEPEPGLPPDLVFRRGVLEPPLVGVWAVRRPGLPAIRIGEQSSGSVLWVDSPQPASARSPFDVRPNPPGYEPIAPPIGIGADARFQAPGGAA